MAKSNLLRPKDIILDVMCEQEMSFAQWTKEVMDACLNRQSKQQLIRLPRSFKLPLLKIEEDHLLHATSYFNDACFDHSKPLRKRKQGRMLREGPLEVEKVHVSTYTKKTIEGPSVESDSFKRWRDRRHPAKMCKLEAKAKSENKEAVADKMSIAGKMKRRVKKKRVETQLIASTRPCSSESGARSKLACHEGCASHKSRRHCFAW
eukprot:Platyproteum_vivax@DN7392_c0_g1_i1.p1